MPELNTIELCAGGGGQAIGLDRAGFNHVALVEFDRDACATLRQNRPLWPVQEVDLRKFSAKSFKKVFLVAGGVPCQPFSDAGNKLGPRDDRNLFPQALRILQECRPLFFFFENVRGFGFPRFASYRARLFRQFQELGYRFEWRIIDSSEFGVPQRRSRAIIVGTRLRGSTPFPWPDNSKVKPRYLSDLVSPLLSQNGWAANASWKLKSRCFAPTIVGGSKRHGGADIGPSGAREIWRKLGIDGSSIANEPPTAGFRGRPRLTNQMVARIQGFSDSWKFKGSKTSVYRQIGNALPPQVAEAIGKSIRKWHDLLTSDRSDVRPTSNWLE